MPDKVDKILVSGDVEGNFNQLFKRVSNVNSKNGPFSMLLCVGNFFGQDNSQWLPYKRGEAKVPVATYILGPSNSELASNYPDMKGCELCENVIYLGPSGIYPSSSGLKMVYLSGMEAASHTASTFTYDDIASLQTQATNKPAIDILITSQWPSSVCDYAKKPERCDPESSDSAMISRLTFKLRPRYHFAGTEGVYYERLPYRNHKVLHDSPRHVTRFIGLAKVGNPQKQKWLYAFNITPISACDPSELVKQPPDVTECPFTDSNVAKPPKQSSGKSTSGAQFFYDMSGKTGDDRGQKRRGGGGGGEGGERKRLPPKPTGPCWFCLASPEVEKHLVVSVGDHTYLALAKGGLVPEHLLILPITHFQSTPDLDDDCQQEIEKFKTSLQAMFKKKGKRTVFFERNYRSQHLQVQVVPVSAEAALHLMEAFTNIAESSSIELDEIPKLSNISQIASPGSPFFYVELPTGEKLYHRVKKNFPLQFGREVLASPPILNVTERIDWRECKISVDEETELRNKIREDFRPYDFTLEDDD